LAEAKTAAEAYRPFCLIALFGRFLSAKSKPTVDHYRLSAVECPLCAKSGFDHTSVATG
jgi:hypothetical protein